MKSDFFFVLVGLGIQLIFLFKRELLTDKVWEKWIWIASVILFVIGLTLGCTYREDIKTLPILMVPLMSYSIYWILLTAYKSFYDGEPVDTFWTMDMKLMKAGLFNFLFWFVGLVIPVILCFEIVDIFK